jgi:GDPmannose 4,6-dehydratase
VSVREFIVRSAKRLGMALRFEGSGVDEVGIVASVSGDAAPGVREGDVVVRIDPRYFRPAEVETLLGDPTKAREKLGWTPQITLDALIDEMVAGDLATARQHALLRLHGYQVSVSQE